MISAGVEWDQAGLVREFYRGFVSGLRSSLGLAWRGQRQPRHRHIHVRALVRLRSTGASTSSSADRPSWCRVREPDEMSKRRRVLPAEVAKRHRGLPAGVVWHRAWRDLAESGVVPAVALRRSAAGAAYRAAKCASLACSWAMVCAALAQTLSLGEEVAVRASDRRLTGTVQEQVEGTVVRYVAIIGLDWGS